VANVDSVLRQLGLSPGGAASLLFASVLPTLSLSLRGMPRTPKVMPMSKAALPHCFMVRLSDEEAKAWGRGDRL
jgi:hypothetical protein